MPDFLEIEHKYILDPGEFDQMRRRLEGLDCVKSYQVDVIDRYFKPSGSKIIRTRKDKYIQELTLKSLTPDPEVRTEINISMNPEPSQAEAIEAFLGALSIPLIGTIEKKVFVYYFEDCEVVCYEASAQGKDRIRCLEIEARSPGTIERGKQVLEFYREKLGLSGKTREKKSLFQLLLESDP